LLDSSAGLLPGDWAVWVPGFKNMDRNPVAKAGGKTRAGLAPFSLLIHQKRKLNLVS